MCLFARHSKKEMDKWLKTQPDVIIAYKIVEKRRNNSKEYKLIPYHCSEKTREYKKKNRIRGDRPFVQPYRSPRYRSYKAYFHLWLEIPEVYKYYDDYLNVLIKCHVPKHLITAFGMESGVNTVVSKGFDIVSERQLSI